MARSYRFFVTSDHLGQQTLEFTPHSQPELFHQLTKVLRVKNGDNLILLPLEQPGSTLSEYVYEILTVDKKNITLALQTVQQNTNELSFQLELVLCVPNSTDKLRFVVEKAVELGVTKIILVEGDHSRLQQKLRIERLQSIIKEAAEQSERGRIPLVEIQGSLVHFLSSLGKEQICHTFIAMERSGSADFLKVITQNNVDPITIVIGPEGGFSDAEKQGIHDTAYLCFSLGKRILRHETAAIIALGMVTVQ